MSKEPGVWTNQLYTATEDVSEEARRFSCSSFKWSRPAG